MRISLTRALGSESAAIHAFQDRVRYASSIAMDMGQDGRREPIRLVNVQNRGWEPDANNRLLEFQIRPWELDHRNFERVQESFAARGMPKPRRLEDRAEEDRILVLPVKLRLESVPVGVADPDPEGPTMNDFAFQDLKRHARHWNRQNPNLRGDDRIHRDTIRRIFRDPEHSSLTGLFEDTLRGFTLLEMRNAFHGNEETQEETRKEIRESVQNARESALATRVGKAHELGSSWYGFSAEEAARLADRNLRNQYQDTISGLGQLVPGEDRVSSGGSLYLAAGPLEERLALITRSGKPVLDDHGELDLHSFNAREGIVRGALPGLGAGEEIQLEGQGREV